MKWIALMGISGLLLAVGCGSEDTCGGPDCAGSGGGGTGGRGGSILGAAPGSYDEANEAGNANTVELTGYTMESVNGIALHGSFEADMPTRDTYQFNTGAFGGASSPEHPGAYIQVVIDGDVLGSGDGIRLGLDSVMDHGYSSLSGDYFTNAAVFAGEDYELTITPSATVAGKDYTIELIGYVPN